MSQNAMPDKWPFQGKVGKAYEIDQDGTETHIGASITLLILPGQEELLPHPWRLFAYNHLPGNGLSDEMLAEAAELAKRHGWKSL